jgi:predicted phosphate transport protein (TIGR00153 family)
MPKDDETQILERVAEFTGQVVVIVEKMRDAVERFAADSYEDLAKAAQELDCLEGRADDNKEAILDQLAVESRFPLGRADLALLVSSMDNIANLATGAVDRISMRKFSLPADLNEQLIKLANIDVEAAQALREAVVAMGSDMRLAMELARRVDKIESRADDIYAKLYQGMYEFDTDYKTFHQLKAIIQRLENVADRCCENAHTLRHMALEYLESR